MELKVNWLFTKDVRYGAISNIGWNNFDADCKNGNVFKPKKYWQGLYKFIYFKNNTGEIITSNDNSLSNILLIDEEFEKFYVKKRGMIDIVEISDDFKILRYKTWSCGKTSEWKSYL